MNNDEKLYIFLAVLDNYFINPPAGSNVSVCPQCHVDDFVHIEGCPVYQFVADYDLKYGFKGIEEINNIFDSIDKLNFDGDFLYKILHP